MGRFVPIGIEHYKRMVDDDYYYVDKTLLIKEIMDSSTQVSLFTRPRRFGKTLAMSMLRTFFEDERDVDGNKIDNRHYFEGKKIEACGGGYLEKQGKYPVVSLTLKSAKQGTYELAYDNLKDSISEEFRRHRYVCADGVLQEDEIQKFKSIIAGSAKEADY
ncbi:MAG: AAA family ATPase, partial [Lachnospiraceae bacterium]|nr:AAA family ATPase [Lachnospiraceae bacterium]